MMKQLRKFWYGVTEKNLVRGVVHFQSQGIDCKAYVSEWLRPCDLPMLTAVLDWTNGQLWDEWGCTYYATNCTAMKWETLETRKVPMLNTDWNNMKFAWNEEEITNVSARVAA